jgi:hypothetical protein
MSKGDLTEAVCKVHDRSIEQLTGRGGVADLGTQLHIFGRDPDSGAALVACLPFGLLGPTTRQVDLLIASYLCKAADAYAFVLTTDAWACDLERGETLSVPVSEHPRRFELLSTYGQALGVVSTVCLAHRYRREHGIPTSFDAMAPGAVVFDGLCSGLLEHATLLAGREHEAKALELWRHFAKGWGVGQWGEVATKH